MSDYSQPPARFIPPGYVSVEQAIFRFSEAAAPHAWITVPAEELNIWKTTVLGFAGDALLAKILSYCLQPHIVMKDPPRLRYFYYRDALNDLRQRLHQGTTKAWSMDIENRFLPIRSGWTLQAEGSWFDGITNILETGLCRSKGSTLRVMLYEGDVKSIEEDLGRWSADIIDEGRIGRDLKFAERILCGVHSIGQQWPGLANSWDFVRGFPECKNVTRDEVEQLRKTIDPTAVPKRGRPKKNPELKIPSK